MFFVMTYTIVSAVPDRSSAPRPITILLFGVFAQYVMAVWFILTGVGSIKARRWARVLILYSSWIELICRICQFVLYLLLMPVPRGESAFMRMPWAVRAMTIFGLIIPGVFVLFYGSTNVKATCAFRDSETRWNDKYPLLVLIAILLFGVWTIATDLGSIVLSKKFV
jgi:Ni,Fe-hydrogenase I cytochrome b subunit